MIIGQRIAAHRRRRGLSQAALAGLVGRSESWLSQVERGVRSVDRLSVLLELARVLQVNVEALTGRPWQYAPEGSLLVAGLDEIRRVLVRYEALVGRGPDLEIPSNCDAVHARATMLNTEYQAAGYSRVIRELPDLIVAADRMHASAKGQQKHLVAYVLVYIVTAKLLTKAGAADLAAVAADRAAMTAATLESEVVRGMAAYQVVCSLLRSDRTDEAEMLAVSMAERLADGVPPDDPELLSITGALWLIAAVIAGRRTQRTEAWARLAQAEALARLLGTNANLAWTAFGPANVAIHRVSVAAELGDPSGALSAAEAVRLDDLPIGLQSRRAQVHLDLAWAKSQRRRDAEATLHLLQAERAAPESIRYNVMARETLREMLGRQRRRPTRILTDLAARAGALE